MEKWTSAMIEYAEKNKTRPRAEIAAYLTRHHRKITPRAVRLYMGRRGWYTGRTGRFEQGNVPSPRAKPEGPNECSYKKEHRPANTLPVGTETLTRRGDIKVKVDDKQWKYKHVMLWEDKYGPAPKGHVIYVIDGDKNNICLDNLICISRGTFQAINRWSGIKEAPVECRKAIVISYMIKNKIALLERSFD